MELYLLCQAHTGYQSLTRQEVFPSPSLAFSICLPVTGINLNSWLSEGFPLLKQCAH